MRDDIWPDEGDERPPRRSAAAVIAIAAIPWLIVVGLVFIPDRNEPAIDVTARDDRSPDTVGGDDVRSQAEVSASELSPPAAVGEPSGAPPSDGGGAEGPVDPASEPGAPSDLELAIGAPGAGDPERDQTLGAVATVIARAWTTGVAPRLPIDGLSGPETPRYAEHVAVEAIDHRHPELAIVTLLLVLLEETDDGLIAEVGRLAVPLAVDDGVRPAGSPWWLAAPELSVRQLPTSPYDDPTLLPEIEQVLLSAGYRDLEVSQLRRSHLGPWLVEVAGLGPGGQPVDGTVWLTHDGTRFRLLGSGSDGPTGIVPSEADR